MAPLSNSEETSLSKLICDNTRPQGADDMKTDTRNVLCGLCTNNAREWLDAGL